MKAARIVCLFILIASTASARDVTSGNAYLGILFDPTPLPELINKHLGLLPGQGLRVQNVHRQGPADQAGLARDDLIVALDGQPVMELYAFVQDISQREIGSTLQLDVIQSGKHQILMLTLEQRPAAFVPKHPSVPVLSRHIQPGKVFHRPPGQEQWIEVSPGTSIPLPEGVQPFTQELHVFHYGADDDRCTVTITGDPHDDQTMISIQQGNDRYSTTVEAVDTLPDTVKENTQQALGQARQKARQQSRNQTWKQHSQALKEFWENHTPEDMNSFTHEQLERAQQAFENLDRAVGTPRLMYEQDRKRLEQLEKEVHSLRQRLEALENLKSKDPI